MAARRRFEVILDEDGRLVEAYTHGHRWRRDLPEELVEQLEELGARLELELVSDGDVVAVMPAESPAADDDIDAAGGDAFGV